MHTTSIAAGRTRALVAPEAGGRIVQIEILDVRTWLPLLVAPPDPSTLLREPLLWGCYPMTPWPGRVDGAKFEWEGTLYELPANDGAHSIHGRGACLPWRPSKVDASSCALTLDIGPADGWPFTCLLAHEIAVEDDGVRLTLSVENMSAHPLPAGVGWHPWFRRDVRSVGVKVRLEAEGHYESRADLIPTGSVLRPAGDADLSDGPEIAGRGLDDFYVGVRQPMEIRWGDVVLTMTSSENCRHGVVYTRSERGFCVEPQTCAPDAFNMAARGVPDTGLSVVAPGEVLRADSHWRWTIEQGRDNR